MSVDSVKQPPSGPRAELKRQAIVRAARELFLREGFGVGMDTIAAEAGVSKVTVYNHFGSKEALFTAVITSALDEPLAGESSAALEGLAEAEDLRAALVEAARTWVHAVRTTTRSPPCATSSPPSSTASPSWARPGDTAARKATTPQSRAPCAPCPNRADSPSPTYRWRSSSSTGSWSSPTWSSAPTARTSTRT